MVERFPRFRRRATEGLPGTAPAWEVDPDFDLRRHFHRLGVPAPGNRRALRELVSDLVTAPLDRSKPLWDVYLLEGYGDRLRAALVRLYHAIADGIALARVMLSLTDVGGEPGGFAPESLSAGVRAQIAGLARPATAAVAASRVLAHEGIETLLHPARVNATAHAALARRARRGG